MSVKNWESWYNGNNWEINYILQFLYIVEPVINHHVKCSVKRTHLSVVVTYWARPSVRVIFSVYRQ